jgi:hypothetical protein
MRIRFRPRIGPFVITSSPPPRRRHVSRSEDLAQAVLVVGGMVVLAVLILGLMFWRMYR